MSRSLVAACSLLLLAPSTRAAPLPTDGFADGVRGPLWSLVQDDPSLALSEANGRLEAIAADPADLNLDALYLSNGTAGFRLATDTDFAVTLAYDFNGFTPENPAEGEGLALALGVGRDLDGTDAAAVAFGVGNTRIPGTPFRVNAQAGGVASRSGDQQSVDGTFLGQASSGTFEIRYDALLDDLTLGFAGTTNSVTLEDRVRGVWGADALFVSFGVRGSGFSTASGDAWLDDFAVVSGRVVAVPEPTGLAAVAAGGLLLARRRRGA